jgi:dipeptidyl aminopeptidase/acylaminoacyl peptidase
MSKRAGLLANAPPRILLALGTLSLVLAASVAPSSAATDRPDAVPAMTLVEQRVIKIPGSRLLALSPDGGSIAVARPDGSDATELCIHEVATLEERVCADLSDLESGLWHESVVWSPDSRWLAFAELWPLYFAGGGLWLMDASTGTLTNLLGDGALALYPTFTPDSTAVTFARTLLEAGTPNEAWEFESVDIATVPVTGGEAVRLDDSERQYPDIEHWGTAWSGDGSRLYVTLVGHVDQETSVLDPDSGIWVFAADGTHARQLLSVAGSDDWPPSIVAVSPRGGHVLVRLPGTSRGLVDCCAIVDGVSGAVDPIESLQPEAPQSMAVIGAVLSPDGSLLLTVSVSEDRERQMAIRDVAGRHETILLTERRGGAPPDMTGRVSTWAQNDTILILGRELDRGTLLVLDRGNHDGPVRS